MPEWLCAGCNRAKPSAGAVDVVVEAPGPGKRAVIDFVFGFGVPLVRRDLLECLEEAQVSNQLHIGKVSVEGLGVSDDWVTVRGKRSVIIRGTENVTHRECGMCTRSIYFATGSAYLYPPPCASHDILESDLFGFVVSERVFNHLGNRKWPGLVVERLPALEYPRDGLGELKV